ncbi:MAG: DUF6789 family protein [Gammaproteobacteria bacterium]
MNHIGNSLIAAFFATCALSALLIVKTVSGLVPALDPIVMLSQLSGHPHSLGTGWFLHFFLGTLGGGILFALLWDALPGRSCATRGMFFGGMLWLFLMIVVMPLAGHGLFASQLSPEAPLIALTLQLIYGGILGIAFDRLTIVRSWTAPA